MLHLNELNHKLSVETKFFISLKTWINRNPLSVVLQVLSFKKYSINPYRSNNSKYCLNEIWLKEALESISECRTFWPRAASKIKVIISARLLYCFTHTRPRTISAHKVLVHSEVYNKHCWTQTFTSRFLGILLSEELSTMIGNHR